MKDLYPLCNFFAHKNCFLSPGILCYNLNIAELSAARIPELKNVTVGGPELSRRLIYFSRFYPVIAIISFIDALYRDITAANAILGLEIISTKMKACPSRSNVQV
jgi:hypothetical protein